MQTHTLTHMHTHRHRHTQTHTHIHTHTLRCSHLGGVHSLPVGKEKELLSLTLPHGLSMSRPYVFKTQTMAPHLMTRTLKP